MQDLERLQKELQQKGKLDAVQKLASSAEAEAISRQLPQDGLKDPAAVRAALEQLLRTREGQRLAQKIKDAMRDG